MMITIINFSHPIPEDDISISKIVGTDDVRIIDVSVQVDMLAPMKPQVDDIVDHALVAVGGNPRNVDCVRLPGLSDVAVLIMAEFRKMHYTPNIIRFARVDSVPPRFEPVELIRYTFKY